MEKEIAKKELPTLADLYNENIEEMFKKDRFLQLVNSNPKADWIKTHPTISNWKYIPIDKIEMMLSQIFKDVKIEVLKTGMLLNAVEVTVRVHVIHPITGQWTFHDGVGAHEVQTKKDSGSLLLDMSNINRGAISMALPIAKSLAIKDACDHFGRIFGRDLNRKDIAEYNMDSNIINKHEKVEKERVISYINNAKTISELRGVADDIVEKYRLHQLYETKFSELTENEM